MRQTTTKGENHATKHCNTEAFVRSNCFKQLKSNVLSAARGYELLNESHYGNFYKNSNAIPTNRQFTKKHMCRHIHCKNMELCDEIRQNLYSASCKSGVLVPDTATMWFKNFKKLKAFIESMQNIRQDKMVQFYCHSKNLSNFQQPPAKCLNLKTPVRYTEPTPTTLEAVKHMSPEFQKLLYDHELRARRYNNLHNIPNIQWYTKLRANEANVDTSTRQAGNKIDVMERYCGKHIGADSKETIACDPIAHLYKAKMDYKQPLSLDTYLEEIYKKPNATEMRDSVTSIQSNKSEQNKQLNDPHCKNEEPPKKISKPTTGRLPSQKIKFSVTYHCKFDDLKRKRAGAEKNIKFRDLHSKSLSKSQTKSKLKSKTKPKLVKQSESESESQSESLSDLSNFSYPSNIKFTLDSDLDMISNFDSDSDSDSDSSNTTIRNASGMTSNSTLTTVSNKSVNLSRYQNDKNLAKQQAIVGAGYKIQHNLPKVSTKIQQENNTVATNVTQDVSTSTTKSTALIRRRTASDTALYKSKSFI